MCYVWVDALELEDFIAPGVGGLLLVKVEGLGEGGRQGAVDLDAVLLEATSRAFSSRPSSGGDAAPRRDAEPPAPDESGEREDDGQQGRWVS